MEDTLIWSHIAPTTPDTLGAYPFSGEDPFVLDECPHIYFAANQPKYESKLITGTHDTRTTHTHTHMHDTHN
jgi:DNA polymerase delta subunit 2